MKLTFVPRCLRAAQALGFCSAVVFSSGCATEPGRMTGLGTATGGVLGAGFGALVGAQTGDPATGLLVGGAAGSVAGAAVANVFEAEERQLDSNRTLMRQRDEEIGRRREQLAALRTQESRRDYEGLERPTSRLSEQRGPVSRRPYETRVVPTEESYRSAALSSLPLDADEVRPIYVERKSGVTARSEDTASLEPSVDADQSASPSVAPRAVKPAVVSAGTDSSATGLAPETPARRTSWVVPEKGAKAPEKAAPAEPKVGDRAKPVTVASTKTTDESAPSKVLIPVRKAPGLSTEQSRRPEIAPPENRKEPVVHAARAIPAAPTVGSPRPTAIPPTPTPHGAAESVITPTPSAEVKDSPKGVITESGGKNASGECSQAAQEIAKSGQVSEPAEKLFHYRRALRLCPADARYHIHLGDHYRSLNRFADASFEYKEALALDPKNAEAKERIENLKNG